MKKLCALIFFAVLSSVSILFYAAAEAPKVVRETLQNGLRVIIVPNKLAPVVTTQINYLVGSNEAPAGFPGMAHALEHMMFRGNPQLSADQLATIAAGLGGDFNADTQQTVTQYFYTVPAEYLDIALHVESLRMANIFEKTGLWNEERGAINQEVAQDLSNPEYVFYTQLLEAMFKGTPYAHDALGTHESFDRTTDAMLQNFHGQWYVPNNAILVIVGDVDPDRVLQETRNLFDPIPARTLPHRPKIQLEPMKTTTIKLDTDLPYGLSIVAYRLPGFESPDFAAGQVLADVLGSQRADIYGLVPSGEALAAGFNASSLPVATIGYAMAAHPQGSDGARLISRLKNIVAEYVKQGVPPDLVEASKRNELRSAEFQKNSIPGLASIWSQAVAVEKRNSPEDDIRAIQKVTVADVDRVAIECLVNDTALVAILTPRPSGKPTAAKGYGGGESFAPKEVKPVSLPDWAQKISAPAQIPPSNLKPAVTTLSNGLRLIVQPETISSAVGVYGIVENNPQMETPAKEEGVDQVLDSLFSYGTKNLDRLAFRKAVDDIGADITAGTNFSLEVLAEHIDRGMELLASNLLEPALPESAFKVVQQETAGMVAGELKSPRFRARMAMLEGLYPKNDPELRQATPASVADLKRENVIAYYRKSFRPDLTTMVVIGQIEPDAARLLVEKHFGDWKAVGPKPQIDLPVAPNNKPSATAVPDPSRVQDEVMLAQTLGITRSDPDYYRLQLGNHVLSGGFYASRLYRDLRKETGLVYNVNSVLNAGRTRSSFWVTYACDPPNVSKARAIILKNLRQMQTTPVSSEELQQARKLMIMRIPLSEADISAIADQMLQYSILGLPLDEPLRAAKHYQEITAAQIQTAYGKWIRPEDFVQIDLGPPPK
jgi:zinc protease